MSSELSWTLALSCKAGAGPGPHPGESGLWPGWHSPGWGRLRHRPSVGLVVRVPFKGLGGGQGRGPSSPRSPEPRLPVLAGPALTRQGTPGESQGSLRLREQGRHGRSRGGSSPCDQSPRSARPPLACPRAGPEPEVPRGVGGKMLQRRPGSLGTQQLGPGRHRVARGGGASPWGRPL